MGRGVGATQRAILDALTDAPQAHITISELAGVVSRSPRQVRTAVAALEIRQQVIVTRHEHLGFRGTGSARMPTSGLLVWLPRRRAERLIRWWRNREDLYEAMVAACRIAGIDPPER